MTKQGNLMFKQKAMNKRCQSTASDIQILVHTHAHTHIQVLDAGTAVRDKVTRH